MTELPRVLVAGAGITGPAAAYWLTRAGYAVTVLEEAPALRHGGQNVDVRATGREVLARMGLEDAVRARNTGEVGTRFLDEHGSVVSEFALDETSEVDGATAELEILRGALSEVLVEACSPEVEWRYGASIVAVREGVDDVEVTLSSGEVSTYDLLVVAEGVASRTRRLVFGDIAEERPLGMYITYATIERAAVDDDWWNVLIVPGSRQISLRPDDEGTIRAMLNFLVDAPELEGLDEPGVRAALRERFADLGWQVPRILDGLDAAADLHVDYLRQVRCPTWHSGRTVLLGDAAWCVTTLGGAGSSLAITGAYVLAAFLSQSGAGQHEEAFSRYERWMRPLIDDAQHLPPGVPRIAAPETRVGVNVLRWGTKLAALPGVRSVTDRLIPEPKPGQDLPDLVPVRS